jgi:DNA-binding CsgD family transcriptional regulator
MSGQDHRAGDSHFPRWVENITPLEDHLEIVQLSAARTRATEEAAAAIARQLNGPLTALLLYMNEIKQHSHQFSQAPGNRIYLQQVVENALQQTERVCALVKQMSDNHPAQASDADGKQKRESQAGRSSLDVERARSVMFAAESGQKPLTKREREVLGLISEGCSNKQGAMRMNISPRTFESHRAEAMRKLGARNTADLVRKALLQPA